MSDTGEALTRTTSRPGRCSEHPADLAVATCAICERRLCLACAIPVRGRVVGAECLGALVEDPPPRTPPTPASRRRGDIVALVGFAVVALASVFPWARSAVSNAGFGDAWAPHWSLIASIAGVAGLAVAVAGRRRWLRAPLAASAYAACAAFVVLGTALAVAQPPTLSSVARALPWRFALLGAGIALIGAILTAFDARRRA